MKQVTEEELKELQALQAELSNIILKLGELHLSKKMVMNELDTLNKLTQDQENQFDAFRKKEESVFERLSTKYGTGDIDIVSGEINQQKT